MNKKFIAGVQGEKHTPQNTPDAGNKRKITHGTGNEGGASMKDPVKRNYFLKKMPEEGRPKGTWGGRRGRP